MIKSSEVRSFSGADALSFDVVIGAVGYESRCIAFPTLNGLSTKRHVSLLFPGEARLHFSSNYTQMEKRGSVFLEDHRQTFTSMLDVLILKERLRRVAVDVSSMNRTMIASVLLAIFRLSHFLESAHLIYTPAKFKPPDMDFPAIKQIGPVIPELSGQRGDPSAAVAMVIGLGFEFGVSVGLISRIEPVKTVCFKAEGYDERFDREVEKANLNFDYGTAGVELASYDLLDAAASYRFLESVVFGLNRTNRVVLVPLGPKIFAALETLVAIKYFGKVALWRVSTIADGPPSDAEPSDRFVLAELDLKADVSPLSVL